MSRPEVSYGEIVELLSETHSLLIQNAVMELQLRKLEAAANQEANQDAD